jgi:polyisoprenoid-binding protein YceI
MKQWAAVLGLFALLAPPAVADEYEGIFDPDDHCVAYRAIKDMLFAKNVIVVGSSCKVTATLVSSDDAAGPRVVVEVPIKSLKSGNVLRNRSVSDILGAKIQPDLRFSSEPLDVEALRRNIGNASFVVKGQLSIAGVDHAISFPVEILEFEGRRYVRGRLATTFASFGMETPSAVGGLIARVHEDLDLLVHIDLTQVEGLADVEP